MAKNYEPKAHNPILYYCKKHNLSQNDLCRHLNISKGTLKNRINNPMTMRLKDIHTIASFFGMNVLELIYLLERNKPQIKKEDKWYIENVVHSICIS